MEHVSAAATSLQRAKPRRGHIKSEAQNDLTPRQIQIVETVAQIQGSQASPLDAAFMAKHLVQVTLPHSDPGDIPVWTRTNGDLILVVARTNVDADTGKLIGYPYGSTPRLLLYWMTSEAVRTKSRVLKLGNSLSEFVECVGLSSNTGGGKRSNPTRLKDQMNRLFSATISFQYCDRSGTRPEQRLNMSVTTRTQLWWNPKKPSQENLFESWLELGQEFFETITNAPVPVDVRALRALNHCPLALDLYGWSTYKAYSTTKRNREEFVSYRDLQAQFGTQYADIKDFKKRFRGPLNLVRAVYPALNVVIDKGGIVIRPSKTALPSLH